MKLLILNGVNLNMLGIREPDVYGHTTLPELEAELIKYGSERGCETVCCSSNNEGELINIIHSAYGTVSGIIINAGAYSHYSYALRDAIAAVSIPTVEVHISNVFKRESFRHVSVIAPVCCGYISGLGIHGYKAAVDYLININR